MSKRFLAFLSLFAFMPSIALACACGCGVFDVGTGTMMPNGKGGTVWLEYDYMDQNINWSGTGRSNPANNEDREIVNQFFTAGAQYMFNRSWGAEIEIPYTTRTFNTTESTGDYVGFHHSGVGDVRVRGIYSGLSDDMSTGVTFGFKLPTGSYTYPQFDRDTAIGTGAASTLLGFYHQGNIAGNFNWFTNGLWDHAITSASHYRPGDEWDLSLGSYYNAGAFAGADNVAPLLQLIGTHRRPDAGFNADHDNSGYTRLLISPGFEYDINAVKLYGDLEVPIYQNVNGNQLVPPVLAKFVIAYSF